ncbi:MAG: hypothetical protein KDJ88_11020 [Bauldia sp.]|nr:hypothetical protein [Bauldia sp.]
MSILKGTSKGDVLTGGGHKDTILGFGGADYLFGRGNDDILKGFSAADVLKGQLGDDSLYGGGGNDRLIGSGGLDVLKGGRGKDNLTGGRGDDDLYGGGGRDKLKGGAGHDDLFGGNSNDVLRGGLGDDMLTGGRGNDHLYGGGGDDSAIFSDAFDNYDFTVVAGGLQITHARGTKADGTDFLSTSIEHLVFGDITVDLSDLLPASGSGGGGGGGGGSTENVAPTVIAGSSSSLNLLNLLQTKVDPSISIIDPDDTNMEGATVAITDGFQAGDQLKFTDQNGITGNYNDVTGVLTLTGTATIAEYEQALESVEYGTSIANVLNVVLGQREFTYIVNDGDANSTPTATSTALLDVGLL